MKVLRIFKITLFLIISLQVHDLHGQGQIKGLVTDSSDTIIPFVQVILYDSTNTKILDFTQCDSLGKYQLSVAEPGFYNLAFSILSHKPVDIPIEIRSVETQTESSIVVDVILMPRSLELDEIVVQSERSIQVSGDTITMKVDDFLRGDEEVVEDALKVLPGFDVDEDGTIRFAGKQITKVMIEGSDLFGKGYSMLTKNLDANVLEDVEVLQNFTELAELRGLKKSDDIAINLSLKEEVKFELFGNTTIGINTQEKHEARIVLSSINNRIKQFILLNSNSLGKDPIGEFNQFATSDIEGTSTDNLIDLEITPRNYFSRSLLPISARRMRFNNSGLASYNAIYKPNSKFEFKVNSVGTFDKDKLNRQIHSKYLSEDLILRDLETFSLTDRISSGIIKVESNIKPTISSRLEYEGFLKLDESSAYSTAFTGDDISSEDFGTSIYETSHFLNYISRINNDQALILFAYYSRDQLKDEYTSNPLFSGELFGLLTDRIVGNQIDFFDVKSASIKATWLVRTGKRSFLELDTKSSYTSVDNSLEFRRIGSDVVPANGEVTFPYSNHLTAFKQSAGVLGRYNLGVFNLYTGLEVAYLDPHYKMNSGLKDIPEYILFKPKLGTDWSLGLSKFQFSYLYDASLSDIQEMLEGLRVDDNRTVKKGLGDFHLFRGHNVILNYTYGGWLRRNMVHTTLLYNKNNRTISSEATVNSVYSLLRNTLSTDREIYLANTSADILIPRLKNNLKLSASFSSTNFGSLFNEEVYFIRTSVKTYGLNFRSVFDGKFNYTLGTSWLHQDLNIESSKVKTKQFQYSDLYFDLNKFLKIQFVIEREFSKQQDIKNTTYLMDAYVYLQVKPNKLKVTVEARNLLNNEYFVSNTLDGLKFTSIRYELVPRSILFSLNYRI